MPQKYVRSEEGSQEWYPMANGSHSKKKGSPGKGKFTPASNIVFRAFWFLIRNAKFRLVLFSKYTIRHYSMFLD